MVDTTANRSTVVSEVKDFFTIDYSSIFLDKYEVFGYFTSPFVPIISVILYLILSKLLFNAIRITFDLQPKGNGLQKLTAIHNLILAVYSAWTFLHTTPLVIRHMYETSFWGTLCDADGSLWYEKGFGFWLTHFYISKYYEFIDTWIVLLKGRNPIFLQTFHHAGIALLMWGFVVTSSSVGLIIVCFNSFIHTLMYTYYFLASYGYQSPLKHYLTQAQIIQFLMGMSLTVPVLFMSDCLKPAQRLVLAVTELYTVGLVILFCIFYMATYNRKTSTPQEKKTK